MNAPAPDRLFDLMLRTSYNKRATLDVPIFEDKSLASASTFQDQAVEVIPLISEGTKTALGVAGLVMSRLVSANLRYEPTNDAPFHRSYPSPRGLYPVDIVFDIASEFNGATLVYESENHALMLVRGSLDVLNENDAALRIEVGAALDRIAPLYGELAPTLCALEAGHALQVIGQILRSEDLAFDTAIAGAPDHGNLASNPVTLARVHLLDRFVGADTPAEFMPARISKRTADSTGLERLEHAQSLLSGGSGLARNITFEPGSVGNDTTSHSHRTAGVFPSGMSGGFVAGDEIESLVRAIDEDIRKDANSNRLTPALTLAWTTATDAAFVLGPGAATPKIFEGGRSALIDAFGGPFSIDVDTLRLFAFFSSPWRQVATETGSWGYIQSLIHAGQLAQRIGDRAADAGFFARPFRGMNEEVLESGLGLPGQVFYSVLLGKPRAANPAFSVGPLIEESAA